MGSTFDAAVGTTFEKRGLEMCHPILTLPRLHARMHARTHARTHARMHARMRACAHARTHARTHTCTHARTVNPQHPRPCIALRTRRTHARPTAHVGAPTGLPGQPFGLPQARQAGRHRPGGGPERDEAQSPLRPPTLDAELLGAPIATSTHLPPPPPAFHLAPFSLALPSPHANPELPCRGFSHHTRFR